MELTIKLLALLSLPISVISAWIAFTARNVAKKGLELNQKIYNDRQSHFDLYLIAAHFKNTADRSRVILLNVSVKNLSDTKNSFFATLEFIYRLPTGKTRTITSSHEPGVIRNLEFDLFDKHPKLDVKQNMTSWLVFMEPQNVPGDYNNISYNLIIEDNKGHKKVQEIYLISAYHENLAKKN